jgi:Domain of unknown function (DUF4411)
LLQHELGLILSIDRVKAELTSLGDELSQWVNNDAPKTLFEGTAQSNVGAAFSRMVNWVQHQNQFTPPAKAEFSSVADGWLIAFAKENGLVVVTHEDYAPDVRKKVPIPNVCREFDVEYCDTFTMLKDLGVQFELKAKR